jgi:hypothetical protein
MRDAAFDTEAITADAIALAEHAPTERIRAGSTGADAEQLRAVLAEILERNR